MSSLTGRTPGAPDNTYLTLLRLETPLSGSMQVVEDGGGSATPLSINTDDVSIDGNLGVGIAAPTEALDVRGRVLIDKTAITDVGNPNQYFFSITNFNTDNGVNYAEVSMGVAVDGGVIQTYNGKSLWLNRSGNSVRFGGNLVPNLNNNIDLGSNTLRYANAYIVSLTLTNPLAIANGGTGTATANANVVFAGPVTGSAAAPSFRSLVLDDIPDLSTLYQSLLSDLANNDGDILYINSGVPYWDAPPTGLTTPVAIADGGTGETTAADAVNALLGSLAHDDGDMLYIASGVPFWDTPPSGSGMPGGADTNVQYNDGGSFGGVASFTFDETTHTVTIGSIDDTGTLVIKGSAYTTGFSFTMGTGGLEIRDQSGDARIRVFEDTTTSLFLDEFAAVLQMGNKTIRFTNDSLPSGNDYALVIEPETSAADAFLIAEDCDTFRINKNGGAGDLTDMITMDWSGTRFISWAVDNNSLSHTTYYNYTSTTAEIEQVRLVADWATQTHASRKGRFIIGVYDVATMRSAIVADAVAGGGAVGINGNPNASFTLTVTGHAGPAADATYTLGDATGRWSAVHANSALLVSNAAGTIPLYLQAHSGQTANLVELENSSNVDMFVLSARANLTLSPVASTTGSPVLFTLTGPAHTTLTASTEATDVNFNLARTVQFSTGALATQRAVRVQAPTYAFAGSSTLTNAITFDISGAPVAGTNATLTNAIAARISTGIAAGVALQLVATASQTGDMFDVRDSGGTQRLQLSGYYNLVMTPVARTTGSPTHLTLTGAAHTTLTASAEAIDVNFNLARTVQFSTGALALQRAFVVQAPTYAFAGSSTLSTAVTMDITGAPVAGTNATLTKTITLRLGAGVAAGIPLEINLAGSQSGDAVQIRNSSGTLLFAIDKDGYFAPATVTFGVGVGTPAVVGTNVTIKGIAPYAGKIIKCKAVATTGPTGADLIMDININGTSIWASNQANRITISAGNTTGSQTNFDTTTFDEDDQFSIDVDQVGSTIAGQDITVELVVMLKNQ